VLVEIGVGVGFDTVGAGVNVGEVMVVPLVVVVVKLETVAPISGSLDEEIVSVLVPVLVVTVTVMLETTYVPEVVWVRLKIKPFGVT
jgi:hypothetical protein